MRQKGLSVVCPCHFKTAHIQAVEYYDNDVVIGQVGDSITVFYGNDAIVLPTQR